MNLVVKLLTSAACLTPGLTDLLPATNQVHQSLATNVSCFVRLCHFPTYSLYSILLMRGFSHFPRMMSSLRMSEYGDHLRLLMTESCGDEKGLKGWRVHRETVSPVQLIT